MPPEDSSNRVMCVAVGRAGVPRGPPPSRGPPFPPRRPSPSTTRGDLARGSRARSRPPRTTTRPPEVRPDVRQPGEQADADDEREPVPRSQPVGDVDRGADQQPDERVRQAVEAAAVQFRAAVQGGERGRPPEHRLEREVRQHGDTDRGRHQQRVAPAERHEHRGAEDGHPDYERHDRRVRERREMSGREQRHHQRGGRERAEGLGPKEPPWAASEPEEGDTERCRDREVDTGCRLDRHDHPPHREIPLVQRDGGRRVHDPDRRTRLGRRAGVQTLHHRGLDVAPVDDSIASCGIRGERSRERARRVREIGRAVPRPSRSVAARHARRASASTADPRRPGRGCDRTGRRDRAPTTTRGGSCHRRRRVLPARADRASRTPRRTGERSPAGRRSSARGTGRRSRGARHRRLARGVEPRQTFRNPHPPPETPGDGYGGVGGFPGAA